MPVYEFYCKSCHMIFEFYSSTINTEKRPRCPRCNRPRLERKMSLFSSPTHRGEDDELPVPDMDEAKMERAMNVLAREAEHMDENDPRQAANLVRKLSDVAGLNLGPGMEEALHRMEAGEDPEQIEEEMGDLLEEEEPFTFKDKSPRPTRRKPPKKDEKLYDL
ncbi:MAG: zinc ribbon domain-containing protein [Deltaproteobacteria bacterium]|nr:zinc ribbon domain-containing protein [Deltaproteobacteria bacterium]